MQLGQVSGSDGTTTLSDARAMTVTLGDVTLWVGPGGSLNDNGTATDVTDATTLSDDTVQAGDLGFSGHVDSMKLASLKDLKGNTNPTDDVSYLALDISGLSASLVGLEDVLAFNAWDVGVLLNSASDNDGNVNTTPGKLDWASFTVTDGVGLPDFNDDLNAGVDLSISGAATLNVLSGLAVLKVGEFNMQLGHVSGSDGTTTLSDARAMTVTLRDVTLWVGPGGSLNDNGTATDVTDATTLSDDTVQAGDLGFSGHVDSMKLATLKDLKAIANPTDDVSYLALDISGLSASLVGLEDVLAFNAWDVGVLLNSASDSDGNANTTPGKLDWASFTVTDGVGLPDFNDDLNAGVDLSISGAAALNVLDGLVVLKVGSFEMQLGEVSGGDGTTTLSDARAMTVTLGDVTLWVGPGGFAE